MRGIQDDVLRRLTEPSWFGIGRESASAFACNENWLFRRVETIEFVGRRSVKRSISVDFEVPNNLPDLGRRAAMGAKLVPISVLQKWPPLMEFKLTSPDGLPASKYLRTTNKKLDFGLLLGMADLTLALGEGRAERASWTLRKKSARQLNQPEPERLPPSLIRHLAAMIQDPLPRQTTVAHTVNALGTALEERLSEALKKEQHKGETKIATHIAATVDLAAQLAANSILWIASQGTPGTDRIVRFSYLGAYGASMHDGDGEPGEQDRNEDQRRHFLAWLKRLSISCSWRHRTVSVPLLHTGRHVRYHLDVRAPEGSVALVEMKVMAFPPRPQGDHSQDAPVRSVASLARRYAELDVPDEWVGPESGGFYMDYGKPIPLASTSQPQDGSGEASIEMGKEASAEIVDRRAHVYLGPGGAPSHRVHMQVKLAAQRQGFIQGCAIAAVVIASLMWIAYFNLAAAALHLEPTVVLLSVVPVVLGYVLVRPGEQALERYHITGVRAMALLSGAMPILGALTLVLTKQGPTDPAPDLTVAKPIWLALAIFSVVSALSLLASLHGAAPSKEPNESAS